MQKARKTVQSIRPTSDKPKEGGSTLQVMTVTTSEKKRKPDEREYENPLPNLMVNNMFVSHT